MNPQKKIRNSCNTWRQSATSDPVKAALSLRRLKGMSDIGYIPADLLIYQCL